MSFNDLIKIHYGLRSWGVVGLLLVTYPVIAEEVRLYRSPPSVDDVRQTLFPETVHKTRVLEMVPATVVGPPPVVPEKFSTGATAQAPAQASHPAKVKKHPKVAQHPAPVQPMPAQPAPANAVQPNMAQTPAVLAVPVQFASNSARLEAEQDKFLVPIGEVMMSDNTKRSRLIIEGHTDALGSAAYNRGLSLRRAEAVKQFLMSRYGIEPGRLLTIGKGQSDLLVKDNPYDERNRRVQIRRYQ